MSPEEIQVPKGWELKTIDDVGDVKGGKRVPVGHSLKNEKTEHPYLSVKDLKDNSVKVGQIKYLDDETWRKIKNYTISHDDVYFTIAGTIGDVGLIPKEWSGSNLTENASKICNLNGVTKNYLYSVLQSNYVQKQIKEKTSRVGVSKFGLFKIRNLIIPVPNSIETQNKIVQKLDNIFKQLDEKKKQVLSLIEQNKERIDFFEKNWLSFIIDNAIEKHPQRNEWKLGKVNEYVKDIEKRDPTKTPNLSFKYVEIGSVNEDKKIGEFKQVVGHNAPSRARNVIRTDDVIYGTTRPYYRNVVLVPPEFNNEICSTGFCVLRIKHSEVLSDYLFYYMLSNIANTQILKPMRGGNYPAVSNNDVIAISIPIPSILIQKQIIQNIKNAEEKFKEQKTQFENIKESYESKIKYINHIQSSILDSAFSGKLVN